MGPLAALTLLVGTAGGQAPEDLPIEGGASPPVAAETAPVAGPALVVDPAPTEGARLPVAEVPVAELPAADPARAPLAEAEASPVGLSFVARQTRAFVGQAVRVDIKGLDAVDPSERPIIEAVDLAVVAPKGRAAARCSPRPLVEADPGPRADVTSLVNAGDRPVCQYDLLPYTRFDSRGLRVGLGPAQERIFDDHTTALGPLLADAGLPLGALHGRLCIYYRSPGRRAERRADGLCAPPNDPAVSVASVPVLVTDRSLWCGLAALATAVAVVLVNWFALRAGPPDPRSPPWWRVALTLCNPLRMAITERSAYSLGLSQVIVWTLVTFFGFVYVWLTTGTLLDVSDDVLKTLGIGAGTALASRLNMAEKASLPDRYLDAMTLDTTLRRRSRLGDLIMQEGRPNIFKFQMVAFTLLAAAIVLRGIVLEGTFPELSENLVWLMGISSATYLGNEVLSPSIWKDVHERIKELDRLCAEARVPCSSARDIQLIRQHRFRTANGEADLDEKDSGLAVKMDDLLDLLKRLCYEGGAPRSAAPAAEEARGS